VSTIPGPGWDDSQSAVRGTTVSTGPRAAITSTTPRYAFDLPAKAPTKTICVELVWTAPRRQCYSQSPPPGASPARAFGALCAAQRRHTCSGRAQPCSARHKGTSSCACRCLGDPQGLRTKERSLSLVQRKRQPRPVVSVRHVPEHGGCRVNDNADAVCAHLRDVRDSVAALQQQQTAELEQRLGRRRPCLLPRLSRCHDRRRWSGARRRRRRRLRLVGRSLRLRRRCRRRCRRSIGVGAAERRRLRLERRRLRHARRLRTLRKRSIPPRLEERVQAGVAVGEHERMGAFCVFSGRSVLRAPAAGSMGTCPNLSTPQRPRRGRRRRGGAAFAVCSGASGPARTHFSPSRGRSGST